MSMTVTRGRLVATAVMIAAIMAIMIAAVMVTLIAAETSDGYNTMDLNASQLWAMAILAVKVTAL